MTRRKSNAECAFAAAARLFQQEGGTAAMNMAHLQQALWRRLRLGVERRIALILMLVGPFLGRAGSQESAPAPVRRALLVGCDEYPALRAALGARYEQELLLRGPANDVELVRRTLERVLGLAPEHTRVLAGWGNDPAARPTRQNILAGIDGLAKAVRPGDEVVLYFAGHGSQQRVQRLKSAEEPDGLEEIFLCADARPAEKDQGYVPNALRDDELGAAARRLRDAGASVWLIVDACHSGTMLRGGSGEGDVRLRGVDPQLLGVASELRGGTAGPADERWLEGVDSTHIAALYGATSYGRAPEMALPRGESNAVSHGLFTWILCQELEKTGGRASYRELSERIVAAYQAFPCALTVPTSEGDLERAIAGGAELDGVLSCGLRGGVPFLSQGRLGGLEPGVVAELFELAAGAERSVARVEVVSADLFEARARLLSGELPASGGPWRARAAVRPLGDYRLALALVHPDGSAAAPDELPRELAAGLRAEAERFPLVEPRSADWRIVLAGAGRLWLRPGAREGGSDFLRVDARTLLDTLHALQKARNLKRFAGAEYTARASGEVTVWLERTRAGRKERLRPSAAGEALLHPGDELTVFLEKTGTRIFDVHVFYLDANFGLTQLFPRGKDSARLPAEARGAQALTPPLPVTDDALGLEHVLVFATPRAPASPVLDLSGIVQRGALRSGATQDPLAALLANIAGGTSLRGEPLAVSDTQGTETLLLTLRTEWGELAPPDWPSEVVRGERGRAPRASGQGSTPFRDPWSAGPVAAWKRSRRELGRPDLLLLGDTDVECVLVDLDGDAPREDDLLRVTRERRFEAELALDFRLPHSASYDQDGDGGFDLVLIDTDGDGQAEERWSRAGEQWTHDTGLNLPWLSQGYLPLEAKERAEAARCLAVLAKPH